VVVKKSGLKRSNEGERQTAKLQQACMYEYMYMDKRFQSSKAAHENLKKLSTSFLNGPGDE
jgi:hypothetical protein